MRLFLWYIAVATYSFVSLRVRRGASSDFKHSNIAATEIIVGIPAVLDLALGITLLFFKAKLKLALNLKVSLIDIKTFAEETGLLFLHLIVEFAEGKLVGGEDFGCRNNTLLEQDLCL